MNDDQTQSRAPDLIIKLATTDFMDEHVATCTERCALCSMYQRSQPDEYERAIRRYQAKGN